jgi:hypothetical protein
VTGVGTTTGAKEIFLLGHGVSIDSPVELHKNVTFSSEFPRYRPVENPEDDLTAACLAFMNDEANSALRIHGIRKRKDMVGVAWNSLWTFRLIALACRVPFFPLFSVAEGTKDIRYVISNRYGIFQPVSDVHAITPDEVHWLQENFSKFWQIMDDDGFTNSVRYLANSYFIRDPEAQLMLVWAGIERLIGTDTELRHRVALYTTILSNLSEEDGIRLFKDVKSAYDFRSRVVHGSISDASKIRAGLKRAEAILYDLLRRCVELARVPTIAELERISLSGRVSS